MATIPRRLLTFSLTHILHFLFFSQPLEGRRGCLWLQKRAGGWGILAAGKSVFHTDLPESEACILLLGLFFNLWRPIVWDRRFVYHLPVWHRVEPPRLYKPNKKKNVFTLFFNHYILTPFLNFTTEKTDFTCLLSCFNLFFVCQIFVHTYSNKMSFLYFDNCLEIITIYFHVIFSNNIHRLAVMQTHY